jgi:hypothetical protein
VPSIKATAADDLELSNIQHHARLVRVRDVTIGTFSLRNTDPHMQNLPRPASLIIASILFSLLLAIPSTNASELSPSSSSGAAQDRFLIMDVEGFAILVDAATGIPLTSWTEVSPPFGASPPSSGTSSLSNVSIMSVATTICMLSVGNFPNI